MLLCGTSLAAGQPPVQSRMSQLAADFRPLTALIRVWHELGWLGFQPLEAVFAVVGVTVTWLAWRLPEPR
jgi:hypothetical protein